MPWMVSRHYLFMANERDKPPIEKISKNIMGSVGISTKKTKGGIKFVFKNKEIIGDLKQLGFSISILKVGGGEMPLPILREHVDNQAALEAYWGAMAETARYQFMVIQDEFNYWFEAKYALCFRELQDRGVPKPIQKEVEARISLKYKKLLLGKKNKLRLAEKNYRVLANACYTSIVTKGKMMQTLRNIIQGGGTRMPLVDVDITEPVSPNKIVALSDE